MSIIESNIKNTIKPSSYNIFSKNNLRSSCKIAFTFSMIFLPFGNSYKMPLTRMLTKPAISMQISSIPYLKPINYEDNSRWNKLYDHNTNLYYYTLSSNHLIDRNYNIPSKNDSSNYLTDPFTISSLLDKHNPDANVLVLTGTTTSQDGYIYIDKYNTDNDDYLNTKCNSLIDNSDYEFLYNYYSDYKNVIVVDIDKYYQNSISDMSESESVGCLKRIIKDKRFGNVSSIIFAWAKSEYTNSLLDAIYSIDCDHLKDDLNQHEFKDIDNNDKISKIKQIYDLTNKEKDIIKREYIISMQEEATKKRHKEALRREKYAAFNLDYVELTNTNNDFNKINIKPENIKRATTIDLRIKYVLDRYINVMNREDKLAKKEEKIIKIELDTILTEYENIKKNQEIL